MRRIVFRQNAAKLLTHATPEETVYIPARKYEILRESAKCRKRSSEFPAGLLPIPGEKGRHGIIRHVALRQAQLVEPPISVMHLTPDFLICKRQHRLNKVRHLGVAQRLLQQSPEQTLMHVFMSALRHTGLLTSFVRNIRTRTLTTPGHHALRAKQDRRSRRGVIKAPADILRGFSLICNMD
jgi:hypothetical protein